MVISQPIVRQRIRVIDRLWSSHCPKMSPKLTYVCLKMVTCSLLLSFVFFPRNGRDMLGFLDRWPSCVSSFLTPVWPCHGSGTVTRLVDPNGSNFHGVYIHDEASLGMFPRLTNAARAQVAVPIFWLAKRSHPMLLGNFFPFSQDPDVAPSTEKSCSPARTMIVKIVS